VHASSSADVWLFGKFRLDRRIGVLFQRDDCGVFVPLAMGSRSLDILGVLVERPGELVSRAEIISAVWPGTAVEDSNLDVQIAALRRVLDQGRTDGSCIQTIRGRGYRFIEPVMRTDSGAPPVALASSADGMDQHTIAEEQLQGRPGGLAGPDEPPSQSSRRRPSRGIIAGVTGILFLVAAGFVGWHLRSSGSDEIREPPRLSIVVLPFADLSGARDQQYFADGVTEDLTTDLSRMSGTLVISVDTALTYRNKPVDAKQIGRELGVRYVLEGSLERSSNQVRVNAQLIDAETDTHLWADRFDREIIDLFELQSEITGRIAFALGVELVAAEIRRPVQGPDALDYIFRGREFFFGRPRTPENLQNAISLYEHALRLDPQSAEAKTYLAGALVNRVNYGFTPSPAVDLARAEKLIDEALAAGTEIPWAHYVKGTVLRRKGRWDDAVPEFELALALNRNRTGPLQGLGWCKFYTGWLDEVIPLAKKGIRIGPRDPSIGFFFLIIGDVYQLKARPDEAIVWFDKARGTIAAVPQMWAQLAAAHALRGDLAEAATDLAEARRLSPDDRYSTIARLKTFGPWGVPKVQAMFDATYFAGLRKAGMPEE
jgi:TolB-like protein/DNA-binding winged helix-turn-helix (wHTH) protein